MKLIKTKITKSYGTDLNIFILQGKKYTLLQLSLGWFEYDGWPYFQMSCGMGHLLSILFSFGKIGLCFDILGKNWSDL